MMEAVTAKWAQWALLVLLLVALGAQAQVYKWVDADGVVQYTTTPPPKSAASAKQMRIGAIEAVDVAQTLRENRWSISREGGLERLSFRNTGFERNFSVGGAGGGYEKASGEWSLTGRVLVLRATAHSDPARVGQTERLVINRIDTYQMELIDEAGRKYLYQSANQPQTVRSEKSRQLEGEWYTADRLYTYYFGPSGDFTIRHRKTNGGEKEIGQGRWVYSDPALTLHYRLHRPLEAGVNRTGSEQRLVAVNLGETSVELREPRNGEVLRLVRELR